jgi:hypothetical protein
MSDGWRTERLGDICDLVKGAYPTEGTPPGPYPLVVTAEQFRSAASYQLEGEAVCIPTISSTGHGHASLKRVHFVSGKFAVANLLVAARPKPDSVVSARWLWLYLDQLRDQLIVPLMQGTANVNLRPSQLADIPVLYPPMSAQRRIVDLADTLAEVQSGAERLAAAARALADAIRDEWFGARLRDAPSLASVVEVTNGRLRNPRNASGPYMTRYVRTANVQDGRLVMDEPRFMNFTPVEQARYALASGDVLVTEGSGSRTSIGASCQWKEEIPGVVCFQNHLLRLRPRAEPGLASAFVYEWARWSHHSGRFAKIATGTNILSLGLERVSTLAIPIDDNASMKSFVDIVLAIEDEETTASSVAQAAVGARSAVLGDLLAGRRELPPTYDRFLDGVA